MLCTPPSKLALSGHVTCYTSAHIGTPDYLDSIYTWNLDQSGCNVWWVMLNIGISYILEKNGDQTVIIVKW